MATSDNIQKKEHPSTYFVEDRQSEAELKRLTIQGEMITESMGGVFPEQADPSAFRRVLDVACGPGGWAIDAARTYPELSVIGIDISHRMVSHAREQAAIYNLGERVEFHVMDAIRMLEFPAGFFDLVNMRCSGSFVRTWEWPKIISELLRVTRPGGTVRLMEPEVLHYSNSPAHMQINAMLLCALFKSGHLFEQESTGINAHLAPLLKQYGCQQVQTRPYALEYRSGTPEGQAYYQDGVHMFQTIRPFFQKWGCINGDYEAIRQQALEEMRQSDYHATWNFVLAWGIKP